MEDETATIPAMLRLRAECNSHIKAFTFYDRHGFVSEITPKDIYSLSGKFAYLLRTWGFQAGDVIANGLPNSPERVITDFGIIMAGCILTNCQVIENDGRDFWYTADICKLRGVLIPPNQINFASQLFTPFTPHTQDATSIAHNVTIPHAPTIRKIIVCDRSKNSVDQQRNQQQITNDSTTNSLLDDLRAMSDEQFLEYPCLPSDLVFLAPTSGTSGFNKLVPATHSKVLNHGRSYRSSTALVYYNDRPMGWMGGFPYDFLASGVQRILQDSFNNQQSYAPSILWNILTTTQCLGAVIIPSCLQALIDHFQCNPPENKIMFIATGGQPIEKDLERALGMLCHCLKLSYGSTEASVVAVDSIRDSRTFEDFYCGVVKDDVNVKIVDCQGNDLQYGMKGEIYLKCDRVMQGYYNAGDTRGVKKDPGIFSKDGWYKTGDWGMLKEDRKLFCYGRKTDVVSIESTFIYLSWPESILSKCPLIRASAIVGVEINKGKAVFSAFVVPREKDSNFTANKVIDFFESRIMDTEYRSKMTLSYVHVCDNLPLLPTGKINKRNLRRILRERLKTIS